ncbi:MAG: lytic transglycosylase domain-containing protein [Candidatus Acidiferrales bacterium]
MTRAARFASFAFCAALALFLAPAARADYAVLRSGERLHITGYETLGATVRLTVPGGVIEIPADQLVSVEPEEVFLGPPAQPRIETPYADLIVSAAKTYGVDAELIAAVIAVESNFNPNAVSPRFARGLMQLRPEVVAQYGVKDVFDPQQNIDAGTHYLKDLLERYDQDLTLSLAAYNAGPDRVAQYRGVPPYPETQKYVRRITRGLKKKKTSAAIPQALGIPGPQRPASQP